MHIKLHSNNIFHYLDGCGCTGESDQSSCSFVSNSWAGRVQEIVDAADEASSLTRISMTNLSQNGKTIIYVILRIPCFSIQIRITFFYLVSLDHGFNSFADCNEKKNYHHHQVHYLRNQVLPKFTIFES